MTEAKDVIPEEHKLEIEVEAEIKSEAKAPIWNLVGDPGREEKDKKAAETEAKVPNALKAGKKRLGSKLV